MENNINHKVLDAYSKSFSELLIKELFKKKSKINGKEILEFCQIVQINYFVLKILFDKWKTEINNLKSPYFDYESANVQKAVQAFMNVLSKNILIKKDDFKDLVDEAVYKTLLLIFSPYEFYLQEINNPTFQQISVADLKSIQKYIKINGHLLNAYIERFEKDGIQAVFNDDAVSIFDEVCETFKEAPEDFETYQKDFSKVLPLDLNEVYSQKEETEKKSVEEIDETESQNINETFKTKKQTLLETLEADKKEAIIDIHEKKPLDGIKKSITINQRFMFENDLFNGDKDEFEMVVNYLDNCQTNKEAMEFITENYLEKKNWDMEKEEVAEFFIVINKRFPQ